ncbi:phage baseplate assembly protein [Roseomonas sp. HJA6]|uniref:Phage baseplate assembly protein n=1 Tax=Roseomonas alba TaxID=2846776 RepID=A0ABS7AD40_9PROT|nr:phage baseplate assembly protein [Neoroseomonas alba]MBW6399975.1 phage baseplate assembly protein [Neoroseomonas alba]
MTDMISRGRVRSARIRGGRTLAEVDMADGELRSRVEILLPMGMSAIPESGADVLVLQIGGPDHLVALQADDAALRAPGLGAGDIAIRDKRGQQVVMNGDGITVSGAVKLTIVSTGDIEITAGGTIAITSAGLTHNGKDIGDSHVHGGVVRGGAQTDPPV